jgi:hypothetical protein
MGGVLEGPPAALLLLTLLLVLRLGPPISLSLIIFVLVFLLLEPPGDFLAVENSTKRFRQVTTHVTAKGRRMSVEAIK